MLNVFPNEDNGEIFAQDDPKQSESQAKRYNLRSRHTVQKYQPKTSTSKKNADLTPVVSIYVPIPNQLPIKKSAAENKDTLTSSFSFESKLSKIKISVPLLELLKNTSYENHFKGCYNLLYLLLIQLILKKKDLLYIWEI